jgi:hypothetical protein
MAINIVKSYIQGVNTKYTLKDEYYTGKDR